MISYVSFVNCHVSVVFVGGEDYLIGMVERMVEEGNFLGKRWRECLIYSGS